MPNQLDHRELYERAQMLLTAAAAVPEVIVDGRDETARRARAARWAKTQLRRQADRLYAKGGKHQFAQQAQGQGGYGE